MYKLSKRSLGNLEGVHPDIVAVVKRAIEITDVDFGVTEGLRTLERQKELKAKGASKTLNSRHLSGHAVDLVAYAGGAVSWSWPLYDKIALAMKKAAKELDVPLEWGGDWTSFKDGPHFQLPWKQYPKDQQFKKTFQPIEIAQKETVMSEEVKPVKSGIKTTEFWMTLISSIITFIVTMFNEKLGLGLDPASIMTALSPVFAYVLGRTVVKAKK